MDQRVLMDQRVPVFLLKTKSTPTDGYEQILTAQKDVEFLPYFVPVMQHSVRADGIEELIGLIRRGGVSSAPSATYGGMVFTSQRAVESFTLAIQSLEDDLVPRAGADLGSVPVYSVGPATTRCLRSITAVPLQVFGSHTGNGEALAAFILDHYNQWYTAETPRRPLLFFVGEQRRDVIPRTLGAQSLPDEQRIPVVELEVYGTVVSDTFEPEFKRRLQQTDGSAGQRWVVVFSPAGCEALLRCIGDLEAEGRRRPFVATIGPTTRDHLGDSFHFEPDVCAETPSPEGIQRAILEFMAALSGSTS